MTDDIYLAGPLFSLGEREFNRWLAGELRARGYRVFVPQEHPQTSASPAHIFALDKGAIDNSHLVLANLDGPDPDSGTCWECGYAHGIGKPVVAFRTDVRPNEEQDKTPVNLMLAVSATTLIDLRQPDDRAAQPRELLDRIVAAIAPLLAAISRR